ncbi:MAG: hypothetical protein WC365_09635 [Candidatus Babeliales bacterium]|jgi:hypothetical protein
MKIHYQNIRGEEKFLDSVIHIQNVDNETLEITFSNGRTATLMVAGVEGIYDETIEKEAKGK